MYSAGLKKKGFTLVEVLLVLAILGILTIVTIPNIARSIKGSRLRMGARTVMQAGKYARSMAVLTQTEAAVVFELSSGRIIVESFDTNAFNSVEREMDGVDITMVSIDGEGTVTEGRRQVVYRSNGRCSPYKVEITDKAGDKVTIEVDALSAVNVDLGGYGESL